MHDFDHRLAWHSSSIVGMATGAPDAAGPFASADDFRQRATVVAQVEVRIYHVDSYRLMDILVPEEYARALDEIREFWGRLDGESPGGTPPEIDPRLLRRAGPGDFVPLLDAAPEVGFMERLLILDGESPYDPWFRQATGNPDFKSAASSARGTMAFFARDRGTTLHDEFMYAWSHCLRYEREIDLSFFAEAVALEAPGSYCHRDRALESLDENWALHLGECVLGRDEHAFRRFAQGAPLRAAVLGKALKPCFQDYRAAAPEHWHTVSARVDELNAIVRPLALDILDKEVARQGDVTRITAFQSYLGESAHAHEDDPGLDGFGSIEL